MRLAACRAMQRIIEESRGQFPDAEDIEVVERKGIGHPDTICDGVVEAVCVALGRAYEAELGVIAPMNVDKALLAAGATTPRPGGGSVDRPMHFILGGRASAAPLGGEEAVAGVARDAAAQWIKRHLRFVDPEKHVRFQVEIRPASTELLQVVERGLARAHDTSVGVGYAPLTRTEQVALDVEAWLNDAARSEFPEVGEDVKVMAVRRGDALDLTVAIAFVDRFVASQPAYFAQKEAIASALRQRVRDAGCFASVQVGVNLLDDPTREDGMYLSVLGTSAEAGDDGQVGRGNRVNGLIAFGRPTSLEAAAGKNPVAHVGKIYNVLAHHIAAQIVAHVASVSAANVWLVSQIGRRIDDPLLARVSVRLTGGAFASVRRDVDDLVAAELRRVDQLIARLKSGELRVY